MPNPGRLLFDEPPLSVFELTEEIREILGQSFPDVKVVGEVSNLKKHGSGHIYFTLKDAQAQLKCVIWKSTAQRIKFQIENGQELILTGKIDVYPPHGEYKLIAESLTPKGIGALELAFRQLFEKLQRRGWFEAGRKKPLPKFPQRVGILTSPSGAALRDILRILHERWPQGEVWVIPVPVQGEGAAWQIAETITRVNQLVIRPDVLIVGRGGGSLEDLWAFNEEVLAAAIIGSTIPIISAVGHETDTTIADLVADIRAPTPSAAAAAVVPHHEELRQNLLQAQQRMQLFMIECLRRGGEDLRRLRAHRFFARPLELLHDLVQDLDQTNERLETAVQRHILSLQRRMSEQASLLCALSPLQVLARGYSLTRHPKTLQPIRRYTDLQPGEIIETLLHEGRLFSQVVSNQK